jgi:hypothetical protein
MKMQNSLTPGGSSHVAARIYLVFRALSSREAATPKFEVAAHSNDCMAVPPEGQPFQGVDVFGNFAPP